MKLFLSLFLYLLIEVSSDDESGWSLEDSPLVTVHPCKGSRDIKITYEPGKSPEEENYYNLWIDKKNPKNTVIKIKFDKSATVTLLNQTVARIDLDKSDDHVFRVRFFRSHEGICFHVQGCTLGEIPYIETVNINTKEYCGEPVMGFLDSYVEGYKLQAQSCNNLKLQKNIKCGKRQNVGIGASVRGEALRNDWPWHAALLRKGIGSNRKRYLCGGTLISSYHVLTVAHCVYRPDSGVIANLSVALGTYNLLETEVGAKEIEIEKIIVHERFNSTTLYDDIALLKMKHAASFSVNIQPACLWNEKSNEIFISKTVMGTIVGWGFDDNDSVASKLNQAQIPMIPIVTCLRKEPSFYAFYLSAKKFCAGILNEVVACKGDSGGGFHVFIPNKEGDNSTGTWHVRGIISVGKRDESDSCSGDHYTVFTDVDKYREWILSHM